MMRFAVLILILSNFISVWYFYSHPKIIEKIERVETNCEVDLGAVPISMNAKIESQVKETLKKVKIKLEKSHNQTLWDLGRALNLRSFAENQTIREALIKEINKLIQ